MSEDPSFMASLARGLTVLGAFEDRTNLTITELARLCGLPRSSVGRCLHTLKLLGYVGEENGAYRLSASLLPLSAGYLRSSALASAAQPVVNALRDALGESCSLAVLDQRSGLQRVIYICRAETVRIISVPLNVGSTLPSYCTSMGRVLLSAVDDATLAAYLAKADLQKRTSKTVVDAEELCGALKQVRAQGWSVIDEELEEGLRSIAVPVRDRHGDVVAALNVGALSHRRTVDSLMRAALPELRAGAAHLARAV